MIQVLKVPVADELTASGKIPIPRLPTEQEEEMFFLQSMMAFNSIGQRVNFVKLSTRLYNYMVKNTPKEKPFPPQIQEDPDMLPGHIGFDLDQSSLLPGASTIGMASC